MSLLDNIVDAKGAPSANYLKGTGRTVGRIRRVSWREPTAEKRANFRVDVEILKSSVPQHAAEVGTTATMSLNFRYPDEDLARMRRALAAAETSATGDAVLESTINKAKADKLCGPTQPLVGAVVTIATITKPQVKNPTNEFTKYELEVPSEADLEGLDF